MKRRQFLKLGAAAGSGVAAATMAAPAIAQSMPEIKWRLASSFPRVLDTLHGAADALGQAGCRDDRQPLPDTTVSCR